MYVMRTDGKSCSRELVTGNALKKGGGDATSNTAPPPAGTGKLTFAYPSTQQHLLVWRRQPKWYES